MSEAAAHTTKTADGAFLRSRLGSLLSLFPLGVWSVNHIWNNLAAFKGAQAWQAAVTDYPHPLAHLVTMIVVLLPLVLHAIWGISRMSQMRPNIHKYPFFGNLKYTLQRLAALGLLLFLGAHIWLAMLRPRFVEGRPEAFADLSREMHHHTPTLLVYLLGTLGASYHLANGAHSFAMGWGIVVSQKALKRFDLVAMGLFAVLLGMGWAAIYALWVAGT